MAADAYEAVKAKAPSPIKEHMNSAEAKAAPYVSHAADKSTELVKKLDGQVDAAVKSAQSAREAYLKKVETVVVFLKSQGLKGTAGLALEQVEKSVAEARKVPGAVLKKVEDAFAKLMETEAVQKVLSSDKYRAVYSIAANTMETVSGTWMYVFDFLRPVPAHFLTLSLALHTCSFARYQKAAQNIYPLVAKYADPAMEYATAACAMVKPVGSP